MEKAFVTAGAVTGIGSLPFTDADRAVDFVARYSPRIPFWPQLPQRSRSEGTIEQGVMPFVNLLSPRRESYCYTLRAGTLDEFLDRIDASTTYLDVEHAAGFTVFERALAAGAFPNAEAVKGQLAGPLTLAYCLRYDDVPLVRNNELMSALSTHVARSAEWQVERLKRAGLPIMIFVDEPCLAMFLRDFKDSHQDGMLELLQKVLQAIRSAGAAAGLHCCASGSLRTMLGLRPDILSFDSYQNLESFMRDPEAAAFIAAGGIVAFGMVPTFPLLDKLHASELFFRWLASARGCSSIQTVARQSIVTATCGLGLLPQSSAGASFELARGLSRLIRRAGSA